jgi:pilus assembly protein CpaB
MGHKAPPPAAQITMVAPQLDTDEVLIAAKELPMGTLVGESDFGWQIWPRSAVSQGMIRRAERQKAVEDLKGSITRANFLQGEPIRTDKLVKGPNAGFLSAILPTGMRAVAINIDTQGGTTAGGFILPNDRVDVIRSFRDESASKGTGGDVFVSETLLRNIRVLAIGPNVQEKAGEKVVVGSNATLELDPSQSELIIMAQRTGQLSLALRSLLDASKPEPVAVDDNRGLTVVRYGVATESAKH